MTSKLSILVKLFEKDHDEKKSGLADKNFGIKTQYWFWGSDRYHKLIFKKPDPNQETAPSKEDQSPAVEIEQSPQIGSINEINQMLAQNPEMSGATFYNLLKSKGYQISAPEILQDKSQEADASSSFPQVLADQDKKKEAANLIGIKCKLLESNAKDNGIGFTKFKAVLLAEGMGNLNDRFYYSREALESAVSIFEGKKIFADHPTDIEEQIRPERSVKDVLGHFEKVRVEENEDGQAVLMADVVTLPDKPYEWARALMRHAVEYSKQYPDKSFVGLSINASGDAQEISIDQLIESGVPDGAKLKLQKALEAGIETVKLVSNISDAVSCDLVTEAGAGGKVLTMVENNREFEPMSKKDKAMEAKIKEAMKLAESEEKQESEETIEAFGKPPEKKDGEENPAVDVEKKPEDKEEKDAPGEPAPKHDDEDQDIALIKKLLSDYVGGDGEPSEEETSMAKEAYASAKEMGMEGEEALKCAGYSMKMAKHMASKQIAKESEETKESEEKKEVDKKESASFLKLQGENAKLKENLFKLEKEKEIEKLLQESGLPRAATKVIRAKLEESKTIAEVKTKLELFKEGYNATSGEAKGIGTLFIQPEKQTTSKSSKGLNLSDCLTK